MSSQRYPPRRTSADNFLYSEKEKSDYDWLVTPPGSPGNSSNQFDASDANLMDLNSRLENFLEEEITDNISSGNETIALKQRSSSNNSKSTRKCPTPTRRSTTPSSRSTSRHSTPTKRSTTQATRPTTPTARVTSTTARASSTSSSRSTSRPSTPPRRPSSSGTSRATLTLSSTSSARSISRPSTPTKRPSSSGTSRANLTASRTTTTGIVTSARSNTRPMTAPNTKPGSRPSTPTRRPPTPTGSSTVLRTKPTKPAISPTIPRSRPWEPYEMPGFSIEAPPNLRTTLPDRPQTASSSRSVASSIERTVARRQSCSPSRNRAPIGNTNGAGPLPRGRRTTTSNADGSSLISLVAKGNQMVERDGNVRKLAPRRLTDNGGSNTGKSSSGYDGAGFGRNISKSSFDMALRHMDIKGGNMKGNFRQLVTKLPAASLYSVRSSGIRRKRPVSSSGSSESSVNILCLDGSDDNLSDVSYS